MVKKEEQIGYHVYLLVSKLRNMYQRCLDLLCPQIVIEHRTHPRRRKRLSRLPPLARTPPTSKREKISSAMICARIRSGYAAPTSSKGGAMVSKYHIVVRFGSLNRYAHLRSRETQSKRVQAFLALEHALQGRVRISEVKEASSSQLLFLDWENLNLSYPLPSTHQS